MFFDIQISPKSDVLKYKSGSAVVKFFIDDDKLDKNFDSFVELSSISVNKNQRKNFLSKEGSELTHHTVNAAVDTYLFKKIKIDDSFTQDYFRNYFAELIQSQSKSSLNYLHLIVPSFKRFEKSFKSEKYFLQTFSEGILLGNYDFSNYKSEKQPIKKMNVFLHYDSQKLLKESIGEAEKIISGVYFARDLVNEPAITLTPDELFKRTKTELNKLGIRVSAFGKKELVKHKMKAILAVGSASIYEPKLIVINYKPKTKPKKKIALVGKGVCYDSGGLSIKPTSGMIEMKADMAGGAAVVGIIKAAALLQLPIEIIGIIPAVENMIGGNSYKPGDVIGSASGKSIEVKDTDAEGRIILADALHYASQLKPDEIIDFATLTGAIVVALGMNTAGLFTKNNLLAEKLELASKNTFEKIWRMPFTDDYNQQLKSDIADISNLGTRWGGAITAGKFLEYFVDKKIPWAHIDLAGPAIKHEFTSYTKKWDTGFGVRMMIDFLSA